jgi:hypothetical protein|tara:strand:- start:598 stop:924 length:327 start_codon:yes stop_codon:yes gene_type:complete
MKPPKKIKVGAYKFKVVTWDRPMCHDKDAFGQFLPRQGQIALAPDLYPALLLDTLIHEINHAIYFVYNIHDKDEEERTVHTISSGWTQVFMDNPKLLNFIQNIVNESP